MTGMADHSQLPLISPQRSAAGNARASRADERLEPAFLTAYRGKLRIDARGWVDKAKAYYAHAIARSPGVLRMHVQRITLYTQTADPCVIGALLDLFLVLGDKGVPLRRRMLAQARPLISSHDFHALHQKLEARESDPGFLQLRSPTSVLSQGIAGTTRLITKQATTGQSAEDPLDSARQQLEFGQTEQAQETLEKALLDDSARLDIHLALLEIYRHARDWQRTERMWRLLQARENPALTEWQRLLIQLEEESRTT